MKYYEDKEFVWGSLDCCLFSANILKDRLGIDLAQEFRGKYTSEKEAYSLVDKLYNTKNLKDLVSQLTKLPPLYDFSKVELYDLVLYKGCVGVNYGARSYFLGKKGLIKVPNRACDCYWSIKDLCLQQQQH